jgi:hypothetical protein
LLLARTCLSARQPAGGVEPARAVVMIAEREMPIHVPEANLVLADVLGANGVAWDRCRPLVHRALVAAEGQGNVLRAADARARLAARP